MSNNEVGGADDIASVCSFTRQYAPVYEVELLKALIHKMLLRAGEGSVLLQELKEVRAEARLDGLLGHIATVVGMSYAECGDAAKITDDEALMLIRELLLEADETVIERHKDMRLPRRLRNMLSGL